MGPGMSFDRFAAALDRDAALEPVSAAGLARIDGSRADGLALSLDETGRSWVELPKALIESVEVTGDHDVGDARYPRVSVRLAYRHGGDGVATALAKLLAVESRVGPALWHEPRRGLSFDEFARAVAAGRGHDRVAVTGWAKVDPGRAGEMQFSPARNCRSWLALPAGLVGTIEVLGWGGCDDHEHPVVGVDLAAPGDGNPAARALFALLAHRQVAARGRHGPPGGGATERCEHGHGSRCTNHPDGTSTLLRWYCDGSSTADDFTGRDCEDRIGDNYTFDPAITPDQVATLLERHRFGYSRLKGCGNLTAAQKNALRLTYRKPIAHGVSTNPKANAEAAVGGTTIWVNFGNLFPLGATEIAQSLIHEMMHCAGFDHPDKKPTDVPFDGGLYYSSPPLQAEICIAGNQSDLTRVRGRQDSGGCRRVGGKFVLG